MQKSRIFGCLTLSKLFSVLVILTVFSIQSAFGGFCNTTSALCTPSVTYQPSTGCASWGTSLMGGACVKFCTGCQAGYTESSTSVNVTAANPDCTLYYSSCSYNGGTVISCTSDSQCSTMNTSWSAASTGYQTRYYGKCVNGGCSRTYQTRCAAGYYGASPSCTSVGAKICNGCSRCPEFEDDGSSSTTYGTSAAGSTLGTRCYIPASSSFTDDYGTWKFTNSCYYSIGTLVPGN